MKKSIFTFEINLDYKLLIINKINMKKLMVAIFVALTMSMCSNAQNRTASVDNSTVAVGDLTASVDDLSTSVSDSIVFEKIVHDYGTIDQSSSGETEFVFVNKGNEPLVLFNVIASCGCTSPEWTKTPVPPGGKGSIKVKYNTEILGSFTKSITVASNAVNSNVTLIIRGNVVQK